MLRHSGAKQGIASRPVSDPPSKPAAVGPTAVRRRAPRHGHDSSLFMSDLSMVRTSIAHAAAIRRPTVITDSFSEGGNREPEAQARGLPPDTRSTELPGRGQIDVETSACYSWRSKQAATRR